MPKRNRTVSKIVMTAFCLLVAAVAASCGPLGKDEKGKDALTAAVEAFNRSFRWEDYNSASAWVPPGKKELFWKEVDNFKGKIRIIDFQVREIDHIEKSTTATAILHYQYYRPDSPTLETVTFSQKWFYVEKEKSWQVGQSGYQAITKRPTGL
ncbi:MAG: hypothetical protein WAW37_16665 [Syntrophobacteraceae bacterium]